MNIWDVNETKSGRTPFTLILYVPVGLEEDTNIPPVEEFTSIKSID